MLWPTSTRKSTNRECLTASCFLEAPIGDLVEEDAAAPGVALTKSADKPRGAELVPGAVEHPGAERVEALDPGKVDDDRPLVGFGRDIGGKASRPSRHARPSSGRTGSARHLVARALDRRLAAREPRCSAPRSLSPSASIPLGDTVSLRAQVEPKFRKRPRECPQA